MRLARWPGWVSLEFRLPLLITALLLIILLAGLWATYQEVKSAARTTAEDRLSVVASALASSAENSTVARLNLLRGAARDSSVIAYLQGDDEARDPARARLGRLRTVPGQELPVQLWSPERAVALDLEDPVPAEPDWQQAWSARAMALPDSGGAGPFIYGRDRAYLWMAVPVESDGRRLGWLAQLRGVQTNTATAQALTALIGEERTIYFATAPGEYWLPVSGERVPAPARWPFDGLLEYERDGERRTAFAGRVGDTPIFIVAEAREAAVLARPHTFLRRASAIAFVLLVIGAAFAWLLSRRVTDPLKRLRAASQAIALGDYAQRVGLDRRRDELGVLAENFNHMAGKVQSAHDELAAQYSEARELATELEHANTSLRDAMDTAERLRAEAQKASRAKSEFLATMSHEIRTPINAMLGYTDLLELGVAGPITEKQREHLGRIRTSGRHLVGLVEEVLDLAGVESGRLHLDPREALVEDAVETAVSILQPQAIQKGIDIVQECGCPGGSRYFGDSRRVEQIVLNLVANAVKFTPPDGRITIHCNGTDGENWREIAVQDSGVGIEPEQMERIFEPFVQGQSGYTRMHGGVGLGLAISRRLARMMGGDILVESQPGTGARFTLRLPVRPVTDESMKSQTLAVS